MSWSDTHADYLATEPPKPPGRRRDGRAFRAFRVLSERTPLRTKLITAVLALVIIALVAISVASVVVLRSYLTKQHDAVLQGAMAHITKTHSLPPNTEPGYATPGNSDLVVGVQESGAGLSWNPNMHNPLGTGYQEPLPQLPTASGWAPSGTSTTLTVPAMSGPTSWRVDAQTVNFLMPDGTAQSATLILAVNLGNITEVTRWLILFDLIVGGAIVVVLAIAAIAVVRANLRPLNDIELTAGQIAAGHLDHRIPERDARTEVGSLGRSLNTMLSQIESAFRAREQSELAAHRSEERMRRFIADAGHELRTPLTTIRGFAEYYRQRGGLRKRTALEYGGSLGGDGLSPEELDRIMRRLESEGSRMGLLVEDLLLLARLDQQRPLDMRPVDLLTLAADAVQDARIVAQDRAIDLTVAPGAAFLINGDEARLRQVLANLVNNALTHTPPGTSVRVTIGSGTLHSGAPAVVLDVIDNGPGMTAEQAQRVFERFYRADASRGRSSGGSGLGLAIVASLVHAHGGAVSVRTASGQGADFRVELPLSPDARGADPGGEDLDEEQDTAELPAHDAWA